MYQPGNIADLTVDSLDLLFGKSGSAAVAGNGTVPKRRIDKPDRTRMSASPSRTRKQT